MKEEVGRLKRDVQTIQTALGLDVWTRNDVRRGFLGTAGGAAASLFLALWMYLGRAPEVGWLIYLVLLNTIIILKASGYRKNPAPSAGTRREVVFYNRYCLAGIAIVVPYYFWAQRQGMDVQVLFASTVILTGMWYLFYGISASSRSVSLAGAIPLVLGGFILGEAKGLTQMFCWTGLIGFVGCALEAVLLLTTIGRQGNAASPSSSPQPPVINPPKSPLPAHGAH
jgi:hypothetical protein